MGILLLLVLYWAVVAVRTLVLADISVLSVGLARLPAHHSWLVFFQ